MKTTATTTFARHFARAASVLPLAAALSASAVRAQQPTDFDARARQIVAQMTLDEKIAQLHGVSTKLIFRTVPGLARLGIPPLNITNGPAGIGNGGPGHDGRATALPAPISLAATWDIEASRRYGALAGAEAAALANGLLEAPTINIARIPQNGRTFEGFGEDPFLAGQLAVANVEGIQSQHVVANVKHYAGNNQETLRGTISDDIDERTLREIYLPAFEMAIKDGKAGSLMGAYNKVNGTYSCENDLILNQILKKEWGFDGFVTSDFGAVHSTVGCALGGLDLEMPSGKFFGAALKAAVDSGAVTVPVLDDKLIRRYRTMMQLGVFDHAPELHPIPGAAHGMEARLLAEEGIVLLKNERGTLPLRAESVKTIAVIGPFGLRAMTGGGGSSHVNALYTVTPVAGLQTRVGAGVTVQYLDGKDPALAAAAAKAADIALVFVGDRQTEGRDHPLTLSEGQDALVEAVAAANPRTVVVLKSGGPVLMPWVAKVPAIVEAWYPGEEDGNAVAAILFGDVNPSGRLPITFPKSLADLAANTPEQYPGVAGVAHYSEGVFVGYRHYDEKKIEPLFPFGHGLSYTKFAYRNLKITPAALSASSPAATVDFDITNAGARAGAEVAQVYLGLPSLTGVPQPPRQLKGFRRVEIAPGKTAHVSIALDARAFSYWDTATHGWKVAPGACAVAVGASSRDLRLSGKLSLQ
jgi:beta-glucosidase